MCQVLGMMPCGPGPHGLREWVVITGLKEWMGFLQSKSARCAIWWERGNVAPDVPDHLSALKCQLSREPLFILQLEQMEIMGENEHLGSSVSTF